MIATPYISYRWEKYFIYMYRAVSTEKAPPNIYRASVIGNRALLQMSLRNLGSLQMVITPFFFILLRMIPPRIASQCVLQCAAVCAAVHVAECVVVCATPRIQCRVCCTPCISRYQWCGLGLLPSVCCKVLQMCCSACYRVCGIACCTPYICQYVCLYICVYVSTSVSISISVSVPVSVPVSVSIQVSVSGSDREALYYKQTQTVSV